MTYDPIMTEQSPTLSPFPGVSGNNIPWIQHPVQFPVKMESIEERSRFNHTEVKHEGLRVIPGAEIQ